MKKVITQKHKIIYLIGLVIGGLVAVRGVGALTYQNEVTPEFTWNPTLSLSLSSTDLIINNLAPGSSARSNDVTITVNTNSVAGYNLSATVGDGTTYTDSDLEGASTVFASLATDASGITLSSIGSGDNSKWGYTTATGSSATYSGLPLYSAAGKTLNATTTGGAAATGYTGGTTTTFAIGAYAGVNQLVGEYRNVINFVAVTNVVTE